MSPVKFPWLFWQSIYCITETEIVYIDLHLENKSEG